MASPNVTLILEGMILLFFKGEDFEEGTARSCQVGILRNAPGHIFEIRVSKKVEGAAPVETVYEEEDIRFTLALEVENSESPNITFERWNKDFERRKENAVDRSFKWVLDLEREIYPDVTEGIGAKRKRFRSVLSLKTGTFFTATTEKGSGVSLNDLLICDEHDHPKKVIGKVATRVGVDITLKAASGKATFLNGKEALFEANSDDQYVVTINRIRPIERESSTHHDADTTHDESHHSRDANNYYDAIGQNLTPEQKVYFISTLINPEVPAGPEAACLVGSMGNSGI